MTLFPVRLSAARSARFHIINDVVFFRVHLLSVLPSKGDKAVRLTIGFAFAYYLVFFLLSFATNIPVAKGLFLLALFPVSALWFAFAPYRKSRRLKLIALVLAALYCAFYGIVVLLHGMSNM